MRTIPYGDTGLEVTPLGLGLAAVGRPAYINVGHAGDVDDPSVEGMRRRTHQLLDDAHERGVRYVDAARSYGRAEAFLAGWLDERDVAVTVGSKWGYTYVADWQLDADVHEVKDHGLATFTRQLAETRELLGGRLDVHQVHSATLDTGVLDDAEVHAALRDLAAEGVVVGLSLSGPRQADTLARALELAADGAVPFRSVQATWNVLEPSVGPALAEAAAAGWGVTCKEVVANGRLTDRGDAPAALRELAVDHGATVDAVAIAAALAQPFCTVALSGATTTDQLDQNLVGATLSLADAALDRLAGLAEDADAYWSTRDGLAWG